MKSCLFRSVPGIVLSVAMGTLVLGGCVSNETRLGGGSSMVTGSAGAAGSQGDSGQLFRCARPIGTAALLEPEDRYYMSYGLTSPVPVLRLLMAQSNCFRVVDRGRASSALARERQMARGGELQKGSHMGSGQMVAADYIITPTILRKNEDAGGAFGGLGGLLPGAAGAIAGGLKTHELQAEVLLTATNVRTGVQEAVAQGSASKSDISWGGGGWAGPVAGLGGSYESTDIGKITAAAFLDAHNKLARQLGAIPVNSAATADNAGWYTSRRLNLRGGPNTSAPVLTTLPKGASVMPTGAKSGPWWEVDAAGRQGWVHSDYLTR